MKFTGPFFLSSIKLSYNAAYFYCFIRWSDNNKGHHFVCFCLRNPSRSQIFPRAGEVRSRPLYVRKPARSPCTCICSLCCRKTKLYRPAICNDGDENRTGQSVQALPDEVTENNRANSTHIRCDLKAIEWHSSFC